MELTVKNQKLTGFLKKYKYIILVLLVGVALMIVPSKSRNSASATIKETEAYDDVTENLCNILERISGAGWVEVLLTKSTEKETIYQTDVDHESKDLSENKRNTTVVVSDSSRNESGLIQKINAPTYRGALIVCDGADDPAVRLAIFDAVSKVTGLSTNHIAVIKME